MKRMLLLAIASIACVLCLFLILWPAKEHEKVLEKVNRLSAAPAVLPPGVDEERALEIRKLIADLMKLDTPDFGFSSTLSGFSFAPLEGQHHVSTMWFTKHDLKTSEEFKSLVTIGPDALPFLLAALDDQRPTRIVIKHEGGFGGMWHVREMYRGPKNPFEAGRPELSKNEKVISENLTFYTLKVGDICFVAIGQIIARGYRAVRYQPTMCIYLNTPTTDPQLCDWVRGTWGSLEPRKMLRDSFRADGADMHMLFYFPDEGAPLVTKKLDMLKYSSGKDAVGSTPDKGPDPDDYVQAVGWCRDAGVRDALVRVFKRASTSKSLLASLPAVEDQELICSRLEPLIVGLPKVDSWPNGEGFDLLTAIGKRVPDRAQTVLENYLQDSDVSTQRCHTACLVVANLKPKWDYQVLGRFLTDQRELHWTYPEVPGDDKVKHQYRVCDFVAIALSDNHPELKFAVAGKHADLDKQIAVIQARLGQMPVTAPPRGVPDRSR